MWKSIKSLVGTAISDGFEAPRSRKGILEWSGIAYKDSKALDVFIPNQPFPRQRLPVMIWLHGGGWRVGARDSRTTRDFSVNCALRNMVTIPVSYGLGAREVWPSQLEDVKAAIDWALANVESFGGDKNAIYVGGHSAGAFLALHAGFERDGSVRGVVGVSGVYDLERVARYSTSLVNSLLGDEWSRIPVETRLVRSKKLFGFGGRILLLVAEHELPLLVGDAIDVWKSPRQGRCTLKQVVGSDHVSIMTSCGTVDLVSGFAKPAWCN